MRGSTFRIVRFGKDFVVHSGVLGDNAKFFEKYLTRDIAEILSIMFETKPIIQVSVIARKLSKPVSYVKKRLQLMRLHGLRVKGVIDYYKLGLIIYAVFTSKSDIKDYPYKELIGCRAETLSPIPGVFYGIFTPVEADVNPNKLLRELKPYYYFPVEILVKPKPDFNMYYDFTRKSVKMNYDFLFKRFLMYAKQISIPKLEIAKRLDLLDLLILHELEHNSLMTFKELALRIKNNIGKEFKVRRISRHYKNHIIGQDLIKGCTLAYPPYNSITSTTILLVTCSEPELNYALAKALAETFIHRVSFVSISTCRSIHVLTLPASALTKILAFIRKIRKIFTKLEVYLIDNWGIRWTGIPYHLFNQEKRWWDISLVK